MVLITLSDVQAWLGLFATLAVIVSTVVGTLVSIKNLRRSSENGVAIAATRQVVAELHDCLDTHRVEVAGKLESIATVVDNVSSTVEGVAQEQVRVAEVLSTTLPPVVSSISAVRDS